MRRHVRPILFTTFICCCLLLFLVWSGNPALRASSAEAGEPAAKSAQSSNNGLSGDWSPLYSTMDVPVHISVLPDGRLLYWGRDKTNDAGNPSRDGLDVTGISNTFWTDPLYLEHPGYTTKKVNETTNLFCSGHTFLPDGRLLVTGGHKRVDPTPPGTEPTPEVIYPPGSEFREGLGEDAINIFDYQRNEWHREQTGMEQGRWYPFNVTLGTGETLILAGTYWSNAGLSQLPSAQLNRDIEIRDLQGNLRKLTTDGTSPQIRLYPYLSLTPLGKVFIAKPGPSSDSFDTSRMIDPYAPHPITGFGVYSVVSTPAEKHFEGSSVMYAPGKVLLLGGSTGALGGAQSANAEYIDFTNGSTPQWMGAGTMSRARQFPLATVLPDGQVLVTGGTSCPGINNLNCANGAVHTPDLWNPDSRSFQQMKATPSQIPRVYHSIALLLPDGRVLVGGGGLPAAEGEIAGGITCRNVDPSMNPAQCRKFGHKNVEIFSPPYLYNADGTPAVRPVITSAPQTVTYGQTINIGIGDVSTSDIREVVLIRLPSVTHTFNQDQRRVVLGTPVATSADSISVSGPANGNVCPPGPYMMFLIKHGRNTPSEAKIIRVGHLSLDRAGKTFSSSGTGVLTDSITITNSSGLGWTAQPDADASPWVTIASGATGSGNGTVLFRVAPNTAPNAAQRKGKIIISPTGQGNSNKYEFTVYQAADFGDVNYQQGNPSFINGINTIYAREITIGCSVSPRLYCPASPVKRAEMAVFLTRILTGQSVPPEPLTQRFNDVPISTSTSPYWARSFIEYIARRKITTGCGDPADGLFCPEQPVSRAEMAVFLIRTLGLKNLPPVPVNQPPFNDVPVNYWAAPFIQELARRGITGGCGDGNFCPERQVTREEMAAFMVRAFNL